MIILQDAGEWLKKVYGFSKGSLEFFAGKKKMVAGPDYHRAAHFGPADRCWRQLCPGPFYLYFILSYLF